VPHLEDPDAAYFERSYAGAVDDLATVPWAVMAPRPALVTWLDTQPGPPPGATALVVACGYGDDAEELARRGWGVTAFDSSPTAVDGARERFPDSAVDYRVENLFALAPGAYDLVVEIQTIQSLPLERRTAAVGAIAAQVGPGGTVYLRASGRDDDEPVHDRPWPVSMADLTGLEAAGLRRTWFTDTLDAAGRNAGNRSRMFHGTWRRP
jgi:SAM-dependent methyltransferase